MKYFILEGHKPVRVLTVLEWARWFEDTPLCARLIAKTYRGQPPNLIEISTVFLGIDLEWNPGRAPLVFETMVFGGLHDGYHERSATWSEAEHEHEVAVSVVDEAIAHQVKP